MYGSQSSLTVLAAHTAIAGLILSHFCGGELKALFASFILRKNIMKAPVVTIVSGLLLGVFAGVLAREEYYFSTREKIQHAERIYLANREKINAALVSKESEGLL